MSKLYASASVGNGGKQHICRIRGGGESPGAFALDVIGLPSGPRSEQCEADVTEPGLFEVRNAVGQKGKADDSYILVCDIGDGKLEEFQCSRSEAARIAKKLSDNVAFGDIVTATAEGWDFKKAKPTKPVVNQAEVDIAIGECLLAIEGKPAAFQKRVLAGLKAKLTPASATPAEPDNVENTPVDAPEAEQAEQPENAA